MFSKVPGSAGLATSCSLRASSRRLGADVMMELEWINEAGRHQASLVFGRSYDNRSRRAGRSSYGAPRFGRMKRPEGLKELSQFPALRARIPNSL